MATQRRTGRTEREVRIDLAAACRRADVECIVHLHMPWGVALAMLTEGLQPTSQFAMCLFGRLGRAYEGLAFDSDERRRLAANFGAPDGLILDNHGTPDRRPHGGAGVDAEQIDGDLEWPPLRRGLDRADASYRL